MIYTYKCFRCTRTSESRVKFNLVICPECQDEMDLFDVTKHNKKLRERLVH